MFTHIRPAGIILLWGLQLLVLLEITKFHLHKSEPGAGIIRNAGIIRGRVLFEEIRYLANANFGSFYFICVIFWLFLAQNSQ